jgi:DNA-directed RNA polymerase subunit RPC12/RpoP
MGNATKCLAISIIIALLLGIITLYFIPNPEFSGMIIFIAFVSIVIYFLWYRCSHCGNLGALRVSNTKLLNTNQHQNHFTREEAVGASVRRNRYGDVIDETTHYQDVNYTTTTTKKIYEDTVVCKYCGSVSKKQYQKESKETHRS